MIFLPLLKMKWTELGTIRDCQHGYLSAPAFILNFILAFSFVSS